MRLLVDDERLLVDDERLLVDDERLLVDDERLLVDNERFNCTCTFLPSRDGSWSITDIGELGRLVMVFPPLQ
jgi:hypothetical protein